MVSQYKRYRVQELVRMSTEEIANLPTGRMEILYMDGEVQLTTYRRTQISHYLWRPFREFTGDFNITSDHHLGNAPYKKGAEVAVAGKVLWEVYDKDPNRDEMTVFRLARMTYEVMNTIHNYVAGYLNEYVTTSDMSDIYAIGRHPVIVKAKVQAALREITIAQAYEDILSVVMGDSSEMRHNGIALLARAGVLSLNQLVQLIGPRGEVKATSGDIYSLPIYTGYIDGLSTLYDSTTESRSGSSSLLQTLGPLQDSEYFNRQMQLLTGVIFGVTGVDCGTTNTVTWLVHKEDMLALDGKYHMVDGVAVLFQREDTQYIDKTIQIRSITMCGNADVARPCCTCLGLMARVLPPMTNLGHILTIEPLSSISQLILSTKHVVASQESLYLVLTPSTTGWLRLDRSNPSNVILRKVCASNKFILRAPIKQIEGLNNITHAENPGDISPQRISEVEGIRVAVADRDGERRGEWLDIDTVIGGAGSALSADVIMEIKRNGFITEGKWVEVILHDFKGKSLFVTPKRNEDMVTYLRSIKRFIFGSEKRGESITSHTNVGQAIAALKRILDQHIRVGFIHTEVLVRAMMCVDPENNNYRLPRGGEPFTFHPARGIISKRCVSSLLGFQGQLGGLINPGTYDRTHRRMEHPLDALVG